MGFFGDLWGGVKSGLSSLAPIAGTLLGGAYGGPGGAMMGSQLGGAVGNLFGGGGQQEQPQQQQPQQPNVGGAITNGMNSYIPQQMQNQTFGQMGQNMQNRAGNAMNRFLGPEAGQAGLGQALSGAAGQFLGNRFGGMMPQGWQNQSLGGLTQQAGDYAQSMMPQMPQGGGFGGGQGFQEMGGNAMNSMMPSEFGQAGVGNAMSNAMGNYMGNRMGGRGGRRAYAAGGYAQGGHPMPNLREMMELLPPPQQMPMMAH